MEDITLPSTLFSWNLTLISHGQSVAVSTAYFRKPKWCFSPAQCIACFVRLAEWTGALSGTELTTTSLQQKLSKNYDTETISLNFVIVKISFVRVDALIFFQLGHPYCRNKI